MAREGGGWHALLQPWNRAGKSVFDDSGRFGGLETHLLGQPATTSREQQGTVQQKLTRKRLGLRLRSNFSAFGRKEKIAKDRGNRGPKYFHVFTSLVDRSKSIVVEFTTKLEVLGMLGVL
jgi:hypothetical protein